jgi:hypothetical protein
MQPSAETFTRHNNMIKAVITFNEKSFSLTVDYGYNSLAANWPQRTVCCTQYCTVNKAAVYLLCLFSLALLLWMGTTHISL